MTEGRLRVTPVNGRSLDEKIKAAVAIPKIKNKFTSTLIRIWTEKAWRKSGFCTGFQGYKKDEDFICCYSSHKVEGGGSAWPSPLPINDFSSWLSSSHISWDIWLGARTWIWRGS